MDVVAFVEKFDLCFDKVVLLMYLVKFESVIGMFSGVILQSVASFFQAILLLFF